MHTYTHIISLFALCCVWEGICRLLLENARVCLQIPTPTPSSPLSLLRFLHFAGFFLSIVCMSTHTMASVSVSDSFLDQFSPIFSWF